MPVELRGRASPAALHPKHPSQNPQFAPTASVCTNSSTTSSGTTRLGTTEPRVTHHPTRLRLTEQPALANQPSRTEEAESGAFHYRLLLSPTLAPVPCAKPSGPMRNQLPTAGRISVSSSHSRALRSAGSAWFLSPFLPAAAGLRPTDTPEAVSLQPQLPVKTRPHRRQTCSVGRAGPLLCFHPQHQVSCQQHPEPPRPAGKEPLPLHHCRWFYQPGPVRFMPDASPGKYVQERRTGGCCRRRRCRSRPSARGRRAGTRGPSALSCLPPWISSAPRIRGGRNPKVLLWLSRAG